MKKCFQVILSTFGFEKVVLVELIIRVVEFLLWMWCRRRCLERIKVDQCIVIVVVC